ncbi:MAG: hypothetical protein ABIY70_06865 [Capsulimonas sp.]|uniref:hypothetical protein n=1 Tax=Capsulimonas sp. TaxID=2494211 RepID=UPI003263B87E
MDQSTSNDELTCPKDRTSLFIDNCKNYCVECNTFYCPICLSPWVPFATADDAICPHYVAHFVAFYAGYSDNKDRDDGLLSVREDLAEEHSNSENRVPSATFKKIFEELDMDQEQRAEEILEEMDDDETETTFGPLYEYMQDADTFDIDTACEALNIPIQTAFHDNEAWIYVYFSPIGGDQVWGILRPALQKYEQGIAWLSEQVNAA